ncbi:DpnI domain-containing protein [Geodermatophilus sp. SYSU D00758]
MGRWAVSVPAPRRSAPGCAASDCSRVPGRGPAPACCAAGTPAPAARARGQIIVGRRSPVCPQLGQLGGQLLVGAAAPGNQSGFSTGRSGWLQSSTTGRAEPASGPVGHRWFAAEGELLLSRRSSSLTRKSRSARTGSLRGDLLLPTPRQWKAANRRVGDSAERWFVEQVPCPDCGAPMVFVDRKCTDFECSDPSCSSTVELKVKQRGAKVWRRPGSVRAGAHHSAEEAFGAARPPHLALLTYDSDSSGTPVRVVDLRFVAGNLLTPEMLSSNKELKRPGKPYRLTSIRTGLLPEAVFVPMVAAGQWRSAALFAQEWSRWRAVRRVRTLNVWFLDVLRCIEDICGPRVGFELRDFQDHYDHLRHRHPENENCVPAGVRRTLQRLRDAGVIEFVAPGLYRRLV